MEASPAKVIQYFNGEKQNLIPLFQRPYTWDVSKLKTLWEDVMVQYELDDSGAHFMGAIVSAPARSVPVGVSKFLIIDGQQRLTTVSVLLCALRDSLDANNSARIQEVYLTNRFREPEDTLKFVPTHADRDVYRSIVLERNIPDGGSRLVEAYHYFREQIKSGLDGNGERVTPQKLLLTLEQRLQVVMINLGGEDDPYLIFESLNFKGEPLNQADLVRNYILMQFRHSVVAGGDQERVYFASWRPLENALKENLTDFLRYYLMKDGENIKQGGIYAAIKTKLKSKDTPSAVENEVKEMQFFGNFFARILHPELEENEGIRARLVNIRNLEVSTSYPLLLRLFADKTRGNLSPSNFEACLALVESFVIRRSVCAVPTNALNKLFIQWAKNFPNDGHLEWMRTTMSSGSGGRRFPNDIEFAEAFKNQAQYGRGDTRYILAAIEKSFGHKEEVNLVNATIEHVMPQTLTEWWIAELGPDVKNIHEKLGNTFGNLTLSGYNPELGNLSFPEKKDKLATTHIELNRWILEQSHWTEVEIKKRADSLFEKAKSLWMGPVEAVQQPTSPVQLI